MQLFSTMFCLAMLLLIPAAGLNAQSAQFRLGAKLWEMDSLYQFTTPSDADVVVGMRDADTSTLVLDARTGTVKRRLPGSRKGAQGRFGKALEVSNDGQLCLVSTPSRIDDTSETTRLYNLSDGSLLWERKEMAVPSFVSSKHNCAFLVIWEWPIPSHVEHADLIDTRDGRTIRAFSGPPGREAYAFPFLDEAEGRLYLGIHNWQDVPGAWIVEFSATTGEELRKWAVSALGPFFKVPHRDSIYFISDNLTHDSQLRVTLLDLKSNSESIALQCKITKPTTCFAGAYPEFSVLASSGDAFTTGTYQLNGDTVLLPYHFDFESGRIQPFLAEKVLWENRVMTSWFPYYCVPTSRTFYYYPVGPGFVRRPLVCLNLDPTSTGVPEQTTQDREFTVTVRGTLLEVRLPREIRGVGRVDIIDLNGRIVLAKQVIVSDARSEIDLAVLPAGHYVGRCTLSSQTFSAPFTLSK